MPKQKRTFPRHSFDTVAVNPERIATLMEIAVAHYGGKCGRCQKKVGLFRRGVVHHRHYRTLGYEKPGVDIVLFCKKCHADLHERAKLQKLNAGDIPFVDPEWAGWLSSKPKPLTTAEVNARRAAEGGYNPTAYKPSELSPFRIVIRKQDGSEYATVEHYPNIDIAKSNAESQRAFYNHAAVVSVEAL